jgi:hypothetical protein
MTHEKGGGVNMEMTEYDLFARALLEGIDLREDYSGKKTLFLVPGWYESAPRSEGAVSARVGFHVIIRSDGSAVLLQKLPTDRDRSVYMVHTGQMPNPKVPSRYFYVALLQDHFPETLGCGDDPSELIRLARRSLDWKSYVMRMILW